MERNNIYIKILLLLFVILFSCNSKQDNIKLPESKNDSISIWITTSKKSSLKIDERKQYLNQSYNAVANKADTSSIRILCKIAYQYLKLKDTSRFRILNKETYQLALKLKDTFTLADVHWNKANYYKKIAVYDTAYYHYNKAYNFFENIDQQYYAAKMLYGMSFIKGIYKDYSGSEILITKAISKYKLLKEYKALYASYNHLALLQKDIKEYDRALFYNNKALGYIDKLKNKKYFQSTSFNNIGNVYIEKGDYSKALDYFNRILENDSLQITNIERYAKIIDNRAYCKLLGNDTTNIKQDFYTALKIRDSIKSKGGVVVSKIHLAKYYAKFQDTAKAINYTKEANLLSKTIKNSRDYLASLKLLASLDSEKAEEYLAEYITYNDSLQGFDRKIQNKFTRIAYETNEYIEETERLSRQKAQVLIISMGILLVISLLYYIRIQKTRNEKLFLEAERQKANEEVYVLTIKQQTKLKEEKTKERNRISQELHDDILGKLFGVRLDLGFLEIKGDNDTLRKHELFLGELQNIEKEIREVSHKLSSNFDSSEIDFSSIIKDMLTNKSQLANFAYQLKIDKKIAWNDVNEIIKVNLYRILQEALQNIIKHAKAENVVLVFSIKKNELIVGISDDGIGFKINNQKKGIGFKNMKSRIQTLMGVFSVHSEVNKGTKIHFTIPIH